jgi:RecB family exonuclease
MTETTDLVAPPVWSLSPSRALDFKNCALLYRFRVIDKLPEPPSLDAARGTVIHGILDRLFDLSAEDRTLDAALDDISAGWAAIREEEPELAAAIDAEPGGLAVLVESTRDLLASYFTLEDPRRIEPAEREVLIEWTMPTGTHLKGFVDRLDRSPAGDLRIVDYKSGRSPSEFFEGKALFQLRFYALVLWRSTGVLPRLLRLYYLPTRRSSTTRRMPLTSKRSSARSTRSPARSRRHERPATGGTSRASSATGARTMPSARPSAALRHRFRCRRSPSRRCPCQRSAQSRLDERQHVGPGLHLLVHRHSGAVTG